jgi:hypothetical protein
MASLGAKLKALKALDLGEFCETGEYDPVIVEAVEENALDPVLVDSKVKVIAPAPGRKRTRAQGTGSQGDAAAVRAVDDGDIGPATRSGRANAKRRKQA